MIKTVFTKSETPHAWRETLAYMSAAFWVNLGMWAFLNWPVMWLVRQGGPFKWSWAVIVG